MGNVYMKSKDTLAATEAECFATINGNRYNLLNAIKLEAKMTKKKSKIPILGKPGGGNRATGWDGSGTMTVHYNTSIFRKLAVEYAKTGEDIYFEIQITNSDKTNKLGRQTILLHDCNFDEFILAKFDASSSDTLQEDLSFTFEDVDMPEEFATLNGLLA